MRILMWLIAMFFVAGCESSGSAGGSGSLQGGAQNSCSSSNCAGCCDFGICQPGSGKSACGASGSSCTMCSGANVCLTGGYCGVDPESKWLIQPFSAAIAASNNGTSWDGDSSPPDVVVTTTCPPASAPTVSKTSPSESYSPAWSTGGCVAKAKYLLGGPVIFTLDDADMAFDDSITSALSFQVEAGDFSSGQVSLGAANGLKSIVFRVSSL